ncbi:ABC transporter permease [Candidatus Magnetomonas plexicatena]|uniref:ABC transporter permease n=1 Tax=Candidatus Magnetomonas plexicatena TaxID=2552947 RepID=UPI001C776B07|nr:FtsX-like permease family protein [Nitrospirales bacterium LBB_01]
MMNLSSTLTTALRALRVNKMRSLLTMLGIVIGVCAVIVMIAVGTGARIQLEEQNRAMGSNQLLVLPGSSTSGGVRMGGSTMNTLTLNDAEAIRKECPAVELVAPDYGGVAQAVFNNYNWATSIKGTTPEIFEIREWSLTSGKYFTAQDVNAASKVCLVGQTVVENLFGGTDPVGQAIRIKNLPFKVIGILNKKGSSPMGQDQDDTIFVPITTAQKKLFGTQLPGLVKAIIVKARSLEEMQTAELQIGDLLRQRHHLRGAQEDDFTVRNITQIMQAAEESSKMMSVLLGSIASVSLMVGGIGIMNIMLVSVTERTREIGIRMAVGAQVWDIRLQFITEAIVLSLAGGITGIAAGIAGAHILSGFAGWKTIINLYSLVISLGFSGLIGVFFGFYPAYRASELNPIDALRYE